MVHALNASKRLSGFFGLDVELLEEISTGDVTENNNILTLDEMLKRQYHTCMSEILWPR